MCSDLRRYAAVPALLLLGALAACGKQGDPMPPLRSVPAKTQDLKARQQGPRVILDFTYPKTTPAGMVLEGGVTWIELFEVEQAAPRESTAPPAFDPRAFSSVAKLKQTFSGSDVGAATFGDRMVLALPLPEEEIAAGAPGRMHYYAVRTAGKAGTRSEMSNIVVVVTKAPPPPPQQVSTTGRPEGVTVQWSAVPGAVGYNVYRRGAQEKTYGPPVHTAAATETSFVDTGARFGNSYIYTVTAVGQLTPLVESAVGSEHEVRYVDRFPPPVPTDLVALAEAGRVRLIWRSSDAQDLAGYIVYRRDGDGGEFRRITEQPVQATEHIDTGVTSGTVYFYRVTAVDQAGNESAPGGEVRAEVP